MTGQLSIDIDDYTQPVEAVVSKERAFVFPVPLKVEAYEQLFEEWCSRNQKIMHDLELTALAIDARGLRVSTKYLIEKQRYEGRYQMVGVPFMDQKGTEHTYKADNTMTPLLARWLLERHPDMRIETRKSIFDKKGGADE